MLPYIYGIYNLHIFLQVVPFNPQTQGRPVSANPVFRGKT